MTSQYDLERDARYHEVESWIRRQRPTGTLVCVRCGAVRGPLLMVLTLTEGWVCQPRCN